MLNTGTALKTESWRLHSHEDLNALRDRIIAGRDPLQPEVVICHGTGCLANGARKVSDAFRSALDEAGIQAKVVTGVKTTGCHGFCSRGPLVIIRPQGLFYQRVKAEDVQEIVQSTLGEGKPVERLLYQGSPVRRSHFCPRKISPFYKLAKAWCCTISAKSIPPTSPTPLPPEDTRPWPKR
jgi:(2Fe-2S) ferredoxin